MIDENKMKLRHQNWMWALRQLMGWPLFKPACDSIAFSSGRPIDFEVGMDCARLATVMRKDLVYSGWSGAAAAEPLTYAIVIRELLTVDIVDRCVPWTPDEVSPVVLLSTRADEVFIIGKRGLLERVTGKPNKIARGRKLATSRIRALAGAMGGELAENTAFAPSAREWVEPDAPLEPIVRFN